MTPRRDIERLESIRIRLQEELDGSRTAAERNRLGEFATPRVLARDMLRYARLLWRGRPDHVRFLDPAVGTGSFFSVLVEAFPGAALESAVGIEVDCQYAETARSLWAGLGLQVVTGDFTALPVPSTESLANLVVANPPYVRHHHLSPAQEAGAEGTQRRGAGRGDEWTRRPLLLLHPAGAQVVSAGRNRRLAHPVGVHGRELRFGCQTVPHRQGDSDPRALFRPSGRAVRGCLGLVVDRGLPQSAAKGEPQSIVFIRWLVAQPRPSGSDFANAPALRAEVVESWIPTQAAGALQTRSQTWHRFSRSGGGSPPGRTAFSSSSVTRPNGSGSTGAS